MKQERIRKCVKTSSGGVYDGELLNNRYDGYGSYIWESGIRYEGEWKEGKMHGHGVMTWPSGARFEGEYKDNKRNGHGKLILSKTSDLGWVNGEYEYGEQLIGNWIDNKKSGKFISKQNSLPYEVYYDNDVITQAVLEYDSENKKKRELYSKGFRGYYFGHSGFLIETPSATLIFDWYSGEIPAIRKDKPLYIFISHRHSDHFDYRILELALKFNDVKIFLGSYNDDTSQFISTFPIKIKSKVVSLSGQKRFKDSIVTVNTLYSTDMGVAYLVSIDGKNIYHAGDLAIWNNSYNNIDLFMDYIEPLEGCKIDYAMLPLDPRVEDCAVRTLERYLDIADIKYYTPMHLWEQYEYIKTCIEENPKFKSNIIGVGVSSPAAKNGIKIGEFYQINI